MNQLSYHVSKDKIEKEGLNFEDKKIISSVIFNRLIRNMRLQIDATVLFAITDGKYNLGRKLLLKDLKSNPKRYVHFSLFGKKEKPNE